MLCQQALWGVPMSPIVEERSASLEAASRKATAPPSSHHPSRTTSVGPSRLSAEYTTPSRGSFERELPGLQEHGHGQTLQRQGQVLQGQGQGQVLQGQGQVLQGQGQVLEGQGQILQGQGQALQGHGQVLQGQGQILQGHGQALQGQGQPAPHSSGPQHASGPLGPLPLSLHADLSFPAVPYMMDGGPDHMGQYMSNGSADDGAFNLVMPPPQHTSSHSHGRSGSQKGVQASTNSLPLAALAALVQQRSNPPPAGMLTVKHFEAIWTSEIKWSCIRP